MGEYIKREAFLKKIEHFSLSKGTTLGKHSGIADEIIDILMEQPTADVVEVVRCRDCIFFSHDVPTRCCCDYDGSTVSETHYCSYGERKEK